MKSLVPMRPDGFASSLLQTEQTALTWLVLSGCSKKDAFFVFCRPDMSGSKAKAAIDDYIKQFFARKEVKEYIEAYEKTLKEFLKPEPKKTSESKEPGVSVEEKKSRALAKLVEYVLAEANHIEEAEDPKAILDYANKIGIFDVNEQVEIKPQRFLGERCGECAYRKFVEENCDIVEDGTELEGEI